MPVPSIPNLRQETGNTVTVPADETWIIKSIRTSGSNTSLTGIIDGNTYYLYAHGASSGIHDSATVITSGPICDTIVVNTGDSFSSSTGVEVSYWIMETDFNVHTTVPPLRQSALTAFGTITVPADETWIVKIATAYYTAPSSPAAINTYYVSASISGNTYTNLWVYILPSSWDGGGLNGGIFDSTMTLAAGDSVTFHSGYVPGVGSEVIKLQIGYWILEQDFLPYFLP